MITFQNVSKRFGRAQVLNDINFSIPEGRVISMLGPNGSGKSTLIKCMLNLVRPTEGLIHIDGVPSNDALSRTKISYMPQVARFAENISATRLIELISDLRSMHASPQELIEYFDLEEHMHKPLGELSGGTRQKVSAVLAFIFDAPIIVLDEPTVGLDPVSRVRFKELILAEKAKGKTIFFTSHIMGDVEEVADELAFLLEGRLVFQGTSEQLKSDTDQPNLEKAIAAFLLNNHSA